MKPLTADKDLYTITYDWKTKQFSGDTIIKYDWGDWTPFLLYVTDDFAGKKFFNFDINTDAHTVTIQPNENTESLANNQIREAYFLWVEESPKPNDWRTHIVLTVKIFVKFVGVDKTNLYFEKPNSSSEIPPQEINISGAEGRPFALITPDFIEATPKEGTLPQKVQISINHKGKNLPHGRYNEKIYISSNGTTETINVHYRVNVPDQIDPSEIKFCLNEPLTIIGQRDLKANFIRISLKCDIWNGIGYRTYTSILTIPYFNERAEIHIGELIHRLFSKEYFEKLLKEKKYGHETIEYLPIKVNIAIEELNHKYEVLNYWNLPEQYYFAGKKPKAFPIFTNHLTRRRVPNTDVLLSYLSSDFNTAEVGIINTNRTAEELAVKSIILKDGTHMFYPKIKEIKQLKIITMEDTRNTFNVRWINQNYVQEWTVFSGEYKVEAAYKKVIQKSIFTSKNKKFASEIEKILKINTGFLFKDEMLMIEELIQSPLCLIELEDRNILAIPSSEKLQREDSTAQLIAFDLEFLIIEEIWK